MGEDGRRVYELQQLVARLLGAVLERDLVTLQVHLGQNVTSNVKIIT